MAQLVARTAGGREAMGSNPISPTQLEELLKMIKYKVAKQLKGYCGPASLKMVFDYHGIIKTQEEWARLSGTTQEGGVQNEGMIKAIKSVGFSYKIIKEASFPDLENLVNTHHTVIATWWSKSGGHYSPVVDVTKKSIIIADPEIGRYRRIGLKKFDHLWFDFAKDNNRTRVISNLEPFS